MSKENCEHWDQAASTYDAEHHGMVGEVLENEIRSWLKRQFTAADKVLELGCGTGIFSAMIADHVKHLTATDLSPNMLEQATKRLGSLKNVVIQTEDACQTSFSDHSFSAVFLVNLLHHADAPVAIVGECLRVLTPGGKVVVVECTGHGTSFGSWLKTSFGRLLHRSRPSEDHDHHHHFSRDDLAALIRDAGLAVHETTLVRQRRPRMGYVCLHALKAD